MLASCSGLALGKAAAFSVAVSWAHSPLAGGACGLILVARSATPHIGQNGIAGTTRWQCGQIRGGPIRTSRCSCSRT